MNIFGNIGRNGNAVDPRFVYNTRYPNRFRGPSYTIPVFDLPFKQNPNAITPYAGFGDCGNCTRSVSGFGLDLTSNDATMTLIAPPKAMSTTMGLAIGAAVVGLVAVAYVVLR